MTPDDLESLILDAEDPWALQRAFEPLSEAERAKLSPAARKIFNQLRKPSAESNASDRIKAVMARRELHWKTSSDFVAPPGTATRMAWNVWGTRSSTLASLALCPLSMIKKAGLYHWHTDQVVFLKIIQDRRPEWLDDWVAHDLEGRFTNLDFETLRHWVRSGICRKPEVDGYYRMFAWHMMRTGQHLRDQVIPPLSRQLLDDPDLLRDIDGLFRVESGAFNNNRWMLSGAADDYETWPDALVKLSAVGHLDRDHLLDLAIDGLDLDFKQNELSGFHGFYRRMGPRAEELLRHQNRYIALLCHPVSHVVKFAIDMLAEVQKLGALDVEPVAAEVQTVFSGGGKGNAIAALRLISRAVDRNDAHAANILGAVSEALRHAQAEVQARALAILEKHIAHLDEALVGLLLDLEVFVSASNRQRLSTLLARVPGRDARAIETDTAEESNDAQAIEPYRVISNDINDHRVLADDARIQPIASIDELIGALSHEVEVVDSPDDVERIIDAISRLSRDRPVDFEARVSPLLHRLKQGGGGSNSIASGHVGVGLALLDVVYTWVTARLYRTPNQNLNFYSLEDAFVPQISHLRTIAERVARGQSQSLLSAPTHRGGWIDPMVWVERLGRPNESEEPFGPADFCLSLLRLAPDNRQEALRRATELALPLRRIAMFALGGDKFPAKVDRNRYSAWISAARCRSPFKDWSAEFAALDLDDEWPGSLKPAQYQWRALKENPRFENGRWHVTQFSVDVGCSNLNPSAEGSSGFLAKIGQAIGGRIATDWNLLPTAAVNRQTETKRFGWSGELTTTWVAQWLVYIWPQNPEAALMKGAVNLIPRLDENSSNWSPGFGYFQALFQRNRPWMEPGHLLLCLGLIGKDADVKGLAVDALVAGIDGRLFDPDVFVSTMTRLSEGEWIKYNRLADGLMLVLPVSELHARAVIDVLQRWAPALDFHQKNAFRLLEVLAEAQAMVKRPLSRDVREALLKIGGGGKAAKIARRLLDA